MRCKMEDLKMAWDLVGVRINEEKTKLMKVVSAQKGGVGMRMLI